VNEKVKKTQSLNQVEENKRGEIRQELYGEASNKELDIKEIPPTLENIVGSFLVFPCSSLQCLIKFVEHYFNNYFYRMYAN
jgi:hypothetical protein